MDAYDVHPHLTRAFVQPTWDDLDVLAWITLLHLYVITLKPGIEIDGEVSTDLGIFEPETWRGASECVAGVWTPPDPRSEYVYWYSRLCWTAPYSDISEAPPEFAAKIFEFVEKLKKHPMVADVQHVS